MRIQEFLGRLDGVRKSGKGWRALCPAHDDCNPSLGIREGDDGRILVHCYAGCPPEKVCEALGIAVRDLFPDGGRAPTPRRTRSAKKRGPLGEADEKGADFEIRTPEGELVAIHRRIDLGDGEKRFFWFHPGKDGELLSGLGGMSSTELPLYGVAELRRTEAVVVVEGEKTADALIEHGVNAVGTVTGASTEPSEDSLRPLLECPTVYLWPDADPEGRKHMERVGRRLMELDPDADVRWVEWPEAPKGGDAADFLAEGREVAPLLEQAKPLPLENDGEDPLLFTLPLEAVTGKLPPFWSEILDCQRSRPEREAVLAALLVVASAALGKVELRYGSKKYAPALMVFVVAETGVGKGAASEMIRLLDPIDRQLQEDSQRRKREWKRRRAEAEKDGTPFEEPEPPDRFLCLAETSSERIVTQRLAENPQGLILFSTEADALATVLQQREWGRFSDILRRASHHERVLRETHNAGRTVVERPVLSVLLTGTPAQLRRLITDGTEDGLYSRLLIVKLTGIPRWISQRPRPQDERLLAAMSQVRTRLFAAWQALSQRDKPLQFTLSEDQWDRLDAVFAALNESVVAEPNAEPLISVVRRAGLATVRMACVLSLLQVDPAQLGPVSKIAADEKSFEAALLLGEAFTKQALALASPVLRRTLPSDAASRALPVLDDLPEEFSAGEFVELAQERAGVSERTAKRWLRRLLGDGAVEKVRRGRYRVREVRAESEESAKRDEGTKVTKGQSDICAARALVASCTNESGTEPVPWRAVFHGEGGAHEVPVLRWDPDLGPGGVQDYRGTVTLPSRVFKALRLDPRSVQELRVRPEYGQRGIRYRLHAELTGVSGDVATFRVRFWTLRKTPPPDDPSP